jgi:NADH-quinone oxidoreductase subunit H
MYEKIIISFMFNVCIVLKIIIIIIPLLLSVAYFTLIERKILGSAQKRVGPNVVGVFGVLQPLSDGLKLLIKEGLIPSVANRNIFILAPILTFTLAVLGWMVIPFDLGIVIADINLGILYLFGISSLAVYGIIFAGWSSNSRYAFLGALRSAAQMVSYEVSLGLILICIVIIVGSLNLSKIVQFQEEIWFIFPLWPLFFMFFISSLAETNRPPFDLPEAEPELVAGYFVEYSSMGFALFFLSEYANIILMSSLSVIFFFGGWLSPLINFNILPEFFVPFGFWFSLKFCFFLFIFVWVRAVFPRYRYNQLMRLGWKIFLPMSIAFVIIIASIIIAFNALFIKIKNFYSKRYFFIFLNENF